MQKNKEIVLTTQMRGDTQTEKWGRDVEALTVAFYIETRCRSRTNCKLFFFRLYTSRVDCQGFHSLHIAL